MLTQQITALSRQWVDQKDGGQFSSTSHLLLGRKWKHNWSKTLQMPQTSAFHFQQLKATSAHVSNHTLPVALLLAWDIWKVSSTGDRIPHPASTQQMHSATESHLPSISGATCPWQPRHSTLGNQDEMSGHKLQNFLCCSCTEQVSAPPLFPPASIYPNR